MSDIVERLRYCGEELKGHYVHAAIFEEAAAEIERLRVLNDAQDRTIDRLERRSEKP